MASPAPLSDVLLDITRQTSQRRTRPTISLNSGHGTINTQLSQRFPRIFTFSVGKFVEIGTLAGASGARRACLIFRQPGLFVSGATLQRSGNLFSCQSPSSGLECFVTLFLRLRYLVFSEPELDLTMVLYELQFGPAVIDAF